MLCFMQSCSFFCKMICYGKVFYLERRNVWRALCVRVPFFMNTLCCIFDGRNSVGSFYIFYLLVSLTSMRFNYMQSF